MIEQTATVIDVEGDQLVVETVPQSSCQSCAVKSGCGTSVLSGTVGRKVVHFRVKNSVAASKGDRVVLGLPEDALVKGSLIVYLLPLLLMIITALGVDAYLPEDETNRDALIATASLLSVMGSIFVGRFLLRNSVGSKTYTPVLIRRLL